MRNSGTYSRAALATRRFRFIPRAAWLGARARNALSRPWRLLGVGGVLFVVVLLSYLFLPAGARGVMNLMRPALAWSRDTTELVDSVRIAKLRFDTSERTLAQIRAFNVAILTRILHTLGEPDVTLRRDSLTSLVSSLEMLLRRAEGAPLPESFRAVANFPRLRGDARVRALVDSLTDVERERDDLGTGAIVDPVFVALTTQLNELGRRISAIGESQVAGLRRQIAALELPRAPSAADSAAVAGVDSVSALAAHERALAAYEVARRALAETRAANADAAARTARERSRTQLAPFPVLMLGAAIIAVAMAFALAMFDEMRNPRVADAVEAERLTSLRVLATARLRDIPQERSRRAADQQLPPALDPTADSYRVLAWHVTSQWPRDGIVTVTGDDALVIATIASNLSAVLANDARVTLLIDADLVADPVRTLLALPSSPGLAAVIENRRQWSEALLGVTVGRGRTIDVLPAGGREAPLGPAESQVLIDEIRRAARRHDATVVVTSLAGAKRFRAGDDVIVCVALAKSRLATLARTVAMLIDDGARVRGVVLWEGALPEIPREPAGAGAA